MHKTFSR